MTATVVTKVDKNIETAIYKNIKFVSMEKYFFTIITKLGDKYYIKPSTILSIHTKD